MDLSPMSNRQENDPISVNWDDVKQAFAFMSSASAAPPGFITSKFGAVLGLKKALDPKADPYERVTAAINSLRSSVGFLANSLRYGSSIRAVGPAAGALGAAAGYLAGATMIAVQFSLIGVPYAKATAERQADGEKDGYLLGFAAGATYADASFVRNYLDVYRQFVTGGLVERAYEEAFRKSLWAGFHAAEKLSPADKNAFISHVIEAAVQHGDKWNGFRDDYESLVHGIANTVTHDISLLQPDAATEHAGSDHSTDSAPAADRANTNWAQDTDQVSYADASEAGVSYAGDGGDDGAGVSYAGDGGDDGAGVSYAGDGGDDGAGVSYAGDGGDDGAGVSENADDADDG
jgi:hypothetical protein